VLGPESVAQITMPFIELTVVPNASISSLRHSTGFRLYPVVLLCSTDSILIVPRDPQDPKLFLDAEISTKRFMDMCNWGLAISVGSLALFTGNFDKFSTKHIEGAANSSSFVLISIMPNKWIFFFGILLIFLSALVFGSIRVLIYYKQFVSAKTLDIYKFLLGDHSDVFTRIKDIDKDKLDELEKGIDDLRDDFENAKRDMLRAHEYVVDKIPQITGGYPFLFDNNYLLVLKVGTAIFLIGLFFVGFYILAFFYHLPS
jgi:hypothetical protein